MDNRKPDLANLFVALASIPTTTEGMRLEDAEEFARRRRRSMQRAIKRAPRQQRLRVHLDWASRDTGLDQLPPAEREALYRLFQRASGSRTQMYPTKVRRALEEMALLELPHLHARVRHILTRLFSGDDSKPVTTARDALRRLATSGAMIDARDLPSTHLVLDKLTVRAVADPDAPLSARLLAEFVALLTQPRCPFGRCRVCGRFFVRVRRQRQCSKNCTARAVEDKRRGKRNKYQRKFMKDKRARERRAQLKALRKGR